MVENVMGRSAEVVFYGFSSPKRPINNIVFLKTWKNIVSFSIAQPCEGYSCPKDMMKG